MYATVLVIAGAVLTVFLFFKLRPKFNSPLVAEVEEEYSVLVEIHEASSAEDLMDIVDEYDFEGGENEAFLKKALEFRDEFDPDDWEDIYQAAEPGSKLEDLADECRSE